MSQITIELTEQQENFLKKFATKQALGSKDNCGTYNPIHVVEDVLYHYVKEASYYVNCEPVYIFNNDEYDDPIEIIRNHFEMNGLDTDYDVINQDRIDYLRMLKPKDAFKLYDLDVTIMYKIPHYVPRAFFFIREEAVKYMNRQKHNLHKPRVFSYSPGYSNDGDYHHFYELLMLLGEKLNIDSHLEEAV